jgi:proteasome lid subunit RPN8/RPN11
MPQVDEIIVSRHVAQQLMHHSLTAAPRSCLGLLAGHGRNIDAAEPLVPHPETGDSMRTPHAEDFQGAAARLRRQGKTVIGWFHSRLDSHEPDENTMQRLEQLSTAIPEFAPGTSPVHLLVALDTKGRMDLYAYARNHANRIEPIPLRLLDDTPLYLRSAKR